MFKIKSQDSLKTDLLMLPHKCIYTHWHPISDFIQSLFSTKKEPQSCQFATYRRNALFEFLTSQTGQMASKLSSGSYVSL